MNVRDFIHFEQNEEKICEAQVPSENRLALSCIVRKSQKSNSQRTARNYELWLAFLGPSGEIATTPVRFASLKKRRKI